jgi:WD40 repeat protein
MTPGTSCPAREVLERFLLGQLPAEELDPLAAHVEHCRRCIATLHSLRPRDTLLSAMEKPLSSPEPAVLTLLLNQQSRWRRGEDMPVEAYLAQQPPLCGNDEAVLELILNEMLLRQERGEAPSLEEYQRRFPHLAEQLAVQFAVEQAIESGTVPLRHLLPPDAAVTSAPPGYVIEGELGRGGMGVVYKARQENLKRTVALKMILSGGHAGPEERLRFLAEAEAIAAIKHPGIVEIHDFGTHEGLPFFALEYCAGGSLASKLAGTPLAPQEAAHLVEQLALAMQAAHERGIIHRDLKPANVLLEGGAVVSSECSEDTGDHHSPFTTYHSPLTPKITDFGLARRVEGSSGLTETGAVMGTPSYMAPEQAEGKKDVGVAVDVYALGAILYECLTGRPPFRAATAFETMMQVRSDEPVRPRQLNPALPHDLETICLKCLSKEPHKRYASALALALDLRHFLAGEPITARPVSRVERAWRWCGRNRALAAAGGLAVVALVTSLILAFSYAWSESRNSERLAVKQEQLLAALKDAEDEKKLAEQRFRDARHGEAVLAMERGLRLCEQEGEGHQGLLWLVRGLEFATQAHDEKLQWCIRRNLGAWSRVVPRVRWTASDPVRCVAISPDGAVVVTGGRDRMVRFWDTTSGRPCARPLACDSPVITVAFSPDGGTLLAACEDGKVLRWNAGTRQALVPALIHPRRVTTAVFSPDSRVILTACDDGEVRLWDVGTGGLLRKPIPRQNKIWQLAFSPDGKRVAVASYGPIVVWELRTGMQVAHLQHPYWGAQDLVWGRDGTTITAALPGGIHLWSVDTAKPKLLKAVMVDDARTIASSNDGKQLLSTSRGSKLKLWDAATLKPLAPTLLLQGEPSRAAFGPDGTTVVAGCSGGLVRMWDLAKPFAPRLVVAHSGVKSVAFSPDGATFATGGGDGFVRLWETASGKLLRDWKHPSRILSLTFSPNGRLLLAGGDRRTHLWDVRTGKRHAEPMAHDSSVWTVEFSRDGKYFVGGAWCPAVAVGETVTGKATGVRVQHGTSADDHTLAVAFSLDGSQLFTGGADGKLRVWQRARDEPVGQPVPLHREAIRAIVFTRDGQHFLTGGFDGIVQLWDARTLKPASPALSHDGPVSSIAFSPDDQLVLAGADTIRIWDIAAGKPVGPPWKCGFTPPVAYHPGGSLILIPDADGNSACIWDVPPAVEGGVERVRLWAEWLTGMRLEGNDDFTILDAGAIDRHNRRLQQLGGLPPGATP